MEGFPLGKIIRQNTLLDLIVELCWASETPSFKKVKPRGNFQAVFTYLQLKKKRKRSKQQDDKEIHSELPDRTERF